ISSAYTNAELSSNKLIIKNLNYFNLISISDTNLNNLKASIQDYITNNQVTVDNVNNHIANINSLVSSVKTTDNQNLGNFVGSVTYSNNAFTIPLTGNNKMNVKSLTNTQVNVNSIVMSNFNFYVEPVVPQESPEDWFTWAYNGTQIVGLSQIGKSKTEIVLPARTKLINSTAFDNNDLLISVDMSLTGISVLPNHTTRNDTIYALFANNDKLNIVKLPPNLISIGSYVFSNCPSLTSITIPDSVTSIGRNAFFGCSSLTSITIPNSVTSIGTNAFYDVPSYCVMTIKRGWNKQLAINAGYKGTFVEVD
ncbi:MAG: leucine-rich repeat domain-containing protein, partial [Ureaplasma sp.]|nr:leucine-rich repeat domain-containing protein [Ureaplasma sp.]